MFDPEGAIWEAETLIDLPRIGYRIAEPLRTRDGQWVHEGWTASRFVEGFCPKGTHLAERLDASRRLHQDLAGQEYPAYFDDATDPWDRADRVAFGFMPWEADPRIAGCLARLQILQGVLEADWQVIHGDLAGNYLLLEGQPPAIIDFTPKWSPKGFGEAVMGVDVFLWEGIPWETVTGLLTPEERHLLPLAATRRLLEVDTRHRMLNLPDSVFGQVEAYERLAEELRLSV